MTNSFTKTPDRQEAHETDWLTILAQAFYGNRTLTDISLENMDRFIRGCLDNSVEVTEPIDRTIVRIPGSDSLVLVYNRYQEEERIEDGKWYLEKYNSKIKPTAVIPELGLTLYSRCIALRMDEDGNFASLQDGDGKILVKYLAR